MKKVVFIHAQVKQYRAPFFEKLHAALRQDGVQLVVAYSDPNKEESRRSDTVDLPVGYGVKVKGYWAFGNRILYQPLLRHIAGADLVVTEQANRYLHNYLLLLLCTLKLKRVAFWGLGENKQPDRSKFSEWMRQKIASRVDWWFAYTRGTADYLVSNHVPPEKITTVQNAVDTQELSASLANISDQELKLKKQQLGMEDGSRTGLFCGMLGADKGVGVLLESAQRIKERMHNFHLLIVGGGPERERVELAAQNARWIHYLGPRFGREKALLCKTADVFLLPGRVGLAILDAFAAGLPLLTTKLANHGPEIEYLEGGWNGLMTDHDTEAYARAVVDVLSNPVLLQEMKQAALESAKRHSIETMVGNCRRGILRCLGLDEQGIFASAADLSRSDSQSQVSRAFFPPPR